MYNENANKPHEANLGEDCNVKKCAGGWFFAQICSSCNVQLLSIMLQQSTEEPLVQDPCVDDDDVGEYISIRIRISNRIRKRNSNRNG